MDNVLNFAWPVTTMGKYDYDALKKCVEENVDVFESRRIVVFGAGIRGTSFSILLQKMGYKDLIFTDNNSEKVGGVINQFPIVGYDKVKEMKNIVVINSVENGFAINNQLKRDGFIENIDFFYIENHLYDLYLQEFLKQMQTGTLIMGDCGITDISKEDSNYMNLGEMLKEQLGDNTKVLAVHAMGMRAFYHILKAHIEYIEVPRRAVIMANFETFTGKQHLLPRSQHAHLMEMISNAIDNQDVELKEYVGITKERFENFKVDYFASSQNALNHMSSDRNDRLVIRMNYMYDLHEDNECIVYMKKIADLCKNNKVELLFFIPPVNYMYAEELYGEKFTQKYQSNVKKLREITEKNGANLLDLSYLLGQDKFADIHTIDETTNYEGRRIITNEFLKAIWGMEGVR